MSRAGIPNKNKQFLLNRLQDMYGDDFHPIIQMAKNASTLQKIADVHMKGGITVGDGKVIDAASSAIDATAAWDKIAPYVEPKLRATEVALDANVDMAVTEVRRTIVRPKNTDS